MVESTSYAATTTRNHIAEIENHSRLFLGIPKEMFCVLKVLDGSCNIPYETVMIALKKIRTQDSNERLAIDFIRSSAFIAIQFKKNIQPLSRFSAKLIFWPSSDSDTFFADSVSMPT